MERQPLLSLEYQQGAAVQIIEGVFNTILQ
jgi:hypothetical protein